ncbi:MAG TPA: nicotinamide riboside transporter PnuC [Chitinophagaceae bacterium]|nr:nicotinamide riboside transporter PnuC [Chitinophagaceae bacterium]
MNFHEILQGILREARSMSVVELLAVVFAVISVLYARVNHILVYPAGIVSILLSIYIFIQDRYRLYPDAGLNGYYLVMSIYGWYHWKQKDSAQKETPITRCSRGEWGIALAWFFPIWLVLYIVLSRYHINNVPLLDSFVNASACCGMWLLARRKIENWLVLLVSDFFGVPLYFIKHLYLFSLLMILYLVIAVMGYRTWKRSLELPAPPAPSPVAG